MRNSYTTIGIAEVGVQMSLSDLDLLRKIVKEAAAEEDARFGTKELLKEIDKAMLGLCEDMRRRANHVIEMIEED